MLTCRDGRHPWIRSAEVGSLHLSERGRSASSPYLAHACKYAHTLSQSCTQTQKPGGEASSSSAAWPRLNTLQLAACSLEQPAEGSPFCSQPLKKGSKYVHAVVTWFWFMESNRPTGQQRVERPLHVGEGLNFFRAVIYPHTFLHVHHYAVWDLLRPEAKVHVSAQFAASS